MTDAQSPKNKTSAPGLRTQAETDAPEIIAESIAELAAGMRRLRAGRLNERAVIALLRASCGVPTKQIELVLGALDSLGERYLKPAKKDTTSKAKKKTKGDTK